MPKKENDAYISAVADRIVAAHNVAIQDKNNEVLLARLDERTANIEGGIRRIEDTFSAQIIELKKDLRTETERTVELEKQMSDFKGKWSVLIIGIGALAGLISSIIGQLLAPLFIPR